MIGADAISLVAAVDWHHGEIGTGWWFVMMVLMVLFWAAVIAAVVWLVRNAAAGASSPGRTRDPQELLDERLAAGGIGIEEYERVRTALERKPAAPA